MQPLLHGKAVSFTHSQCVFVALVSCMQLVCAILSSVACPVVHSFLYDLIKSTISEKKKKKKKNVIEMKCAFLLSVSLCPTRFSF
jgi:hypothetical protein